MTEPRQAAQIEAGVATVAAHRRWANELSEAVEWIAGGSVLDLRRALQRIERIAAEIGLSIEPLERCFGTPESFSAEQTDRILIEPDLWIEEGE